ncbi:MAG TPA: WD40 repeat domain-containing protein, partial [Pyrinomonadaceae bacterium]|nr:WD40 repeat domain-containing protein [Pyrinomonadaceae bacterium]
VDQFEEIFTLTSDEAVQQAFIGNLLELADYPDVRYTVVVTMRSDFEPYVAKIPALQALFEEGCVRATPLNSAELRDAIERPAQRVGLKFEEGIIDELIKEVLGEPGGLPLLQFTLLQLWDERRQNLVTWEAYKNLGGCHEALKRTADKVFTSLQPLDQSRARRIFLSLVRPGGGMEVFNNRIPRKELYPEGEAREHTDRVLQKFIGAGLLRETEGETPNGAKIEVAHEALIRNWGTLVAWLDEERVNVLRRLRLADAARQWDAMGREKSALLRGSLLEEALRFSDLNALEKVFVQRSRNSKRLAIGVAVAAGLVVIVFLAASTFIYYRKSEDATDNATEASSQRLAAQAALKRDERPDLALLLSMEALHVRETVEARGSLLEALEQSPRLIAFARVRHSAARALAFDEKADTLVSANADGTTTLWSVKDQLFLHDQGERLQGTRGVALSVDRQRMAVNSSREKRLLLLDTSTGRRIREFEPWPSAVGADFPSELAFSPDGKLLAGARKYISSDVHIWDVETGKRLRQLTVDKEEWDSVTSLAFSGDGKLLAAGTDAHYVMVWDAQGNLIGRLGRKETSGSDDMSSDGGITCLAFRPPANKVLAAGNDENTITMWDVNTREIVNNISHRTRSGITALAFSPDGSVLASGSSDNSIILRNAEARTFGRADWVELVGHAAPVLSLAFSPDGGTLASSDTDKNVILWNTRSRWRL